MLLEWLQYITLYEVYVLVLRLVISAAISVSVVVSCSRMLQFAKYAYYSTKSKFYKRPEEYFDFAPLPDDIQAQADQFPMVAIQLPMFNERAVCQAIIDCACEVRWPRSRLIVQVRRSLSECRTVSHRPCQWLPCAPPVFCIAPQMRFTQDRVHRIDPCCPCRCSMTPLTRRQQAWWTRRWPSGEPAESTVYASAATIARGTRPVLSRR